MKLIQCVIDKTDLTLTRERKQVAFGEVFEVSEERAKEILNATFNGYPVAKVYKEKKKNDFNTITKLQNKKH